jgi:hypothetical protein
MAALVHALATLALSLTRLYTGKVAIVDLGSVDQAVWTALHYGAPTTTVYQPFEVASWLGYLFTPIVLALVPLYTIAERVEWLLVLHSGSIAAAAVPVFLTCRALLGRSKPACGWALLYLVNPFVVNAAIWEYHEKSVAAFAVALGCLGVVRRRHWLVAVAMLLLLGCREHYGLAVAGFGALWLHRHGRDRFGIGLVGTGLAAVALVFLVLMPALNPAGDHPILDADHGEKLDRYGWLALPAAEMATAIGVLAMQGVVYLAVLAITTGGTALLAPAFLAPGLADLAANLLSINPMPKTFGAYHSVALIPLFVIAAAAGSARLATPNVLLRLAFLPTLVLLYMFLPAPVPGSRNFWQITSLQLRPAPSIAEIRALLPPGVSVSAQANVGALFSQRLRLYRFPDRMETADAIVLHLAMPFEPPTYHPFSNPYEPQEMSGVFGAMERVLADPAFGLVYWQDHWLVAARGVQDGTSRQEPRRRLAALVAEYEASR